VAGRIRALSLCVSLALCLCVAPIVSPIYLLFGSHSSARLDTHPRPAGPSTAPTANLTAGGRLARPIAARPMAQSNSPAPKPLCPGPHSSLSSASPETVCSPCTDCLQSLHCRLARHCLQAARTLAKSCPRLQQAATAPGGRPLVGRLLVFSLCGWLAGRLQTSADN